MHFKEINKLFWTYDYARVLEQYPVISGQIASLLAYCYRVQSRSEIFHSSLFPYSLLCDHLVWWWKWRQAQVYLESIFYFIYTPKRFKYLSVYKRFLNLPRCTKEQILLRNKILVDFYRKFPSRVIDFGMYKKYVIIRQLLDDLADYKLDATTGKPSFSVCNGVSNTREILRKFKADLLVDRNLTSFLRNHFLFYLRGV